MPPTGANLDDKQPTDLDDEMREFFFVIRRALLLVVRWIEKKYGWESSK